MPWQCGATRATKDTDIVVPTDDERNDGRLRAALAELGAQPLSLGEAAPGVRWEVEHGLERWDTSAGILDVMRDPDGAPPYALLRERAVELEVFGAWGVYAGREDLIQMKLAAARIQDLMDLDALLDPSNGEPERIELRRLDRELLRFEGEPWELGEPIDPHERELDQLRRALAPSSRRRELERALRARARQLQALSEDELAELDPVGASPLPSQLADEAARVAAAASRIEQVESTEMDLLRRREELGILRRRDRRDVTETLEAWWVQHGDHTVERFAVARERYRRERCEVAQRVRDAAEDPRRYVAETLGPRPQGGADRDAWDSAARSIEAHVARFADPSDPRLDVPAAGAREARASWEHLRRALNRVGVERPEAP